jgi:tetratricopeptide (TPR) repeat protein
MRADIISRRGHHQEALSDLIKATDLEPHECFAWYRRAIAHDTLSQHMDALAGWTKAIETAQKKGARNLLAAHYLGPTFTPDQLAAMNLAGRAFTYRKLGQWEKSIADYTQAIALNPVNSYYWAYRGEAYRFKGEIQSAFDDYDMAIKYSLPGDGGIGFYHRAQLNQKLGRWDEAISDWTELAKVQQPCTTASSIRTNLANLLRDCPERSQRDPRRPLKTSKEVEPQPQPFSLSEHWQIVGAAHYQLGEWQKAVAALTRAVKDLPGAGFKLAMAYWQLGNHAEARKCYDQAVGWMDGNKLHDTAELRQMRSDARLLLASPK